jgi:hypothetical protein
MRAHISWTTISDIVIGIIVHNSRCPNCAPAAEYVHMPPASLSTLAVMNPGPTTAKNSTIWVFQRLRNFISGAFRIATAVKRRFRINARRESEQVESAKN